MTAPEPHKYRPFPPVDLPDRQWPNRTLASAPVWCSVDLRDGNQALVEPMGMAEKLEMFGLLVRLGFREIEVGFPSASSVEFDFVRHLVEGALVPPGVRIQVLTPAREPLIRRTYEAIAGAREAIVHLYNSTSTVQRRVVFRMDRAAIRDLAVSGTRLCRELADGLTDTHVTFEYSPESFTGTELDFAVEVCDAVIEAWGPAAGERVILNLPATVELSTPNVYADQIEWVARHLRHRDRALISVHTHNDRGTAVAAAELAQLAGAERVEGTLFGYGERTGNVDLVTLALNLYSQGIDPGLDLASLNEIIEVVARCTDHPVHPRHPYSGELVFTAFSGSHQDAISKGMAAHVPGGLWDVPYLPLDPRDIGRDYTTIIRVNSQSGKGGVAYLLREAAGFELPRAMQPEFSAVIQALAEASGKEVRPEDIAAAFRDTYLREGCLVLREHGETLGPEGATCRATLLRNAEPLAIAGTGNGPIDAFVHALQAVAPFELFAFHEHALGEGASARAAAYVGLRRDGRSAWGAGEDVSTVAASYRAVLSALNRLL